MLKNNKYSYFAQTLGFDLGSKILLVCASLYLARNANTVDYGNWQWIKAASAIPLSIIDFGLFHFISLQVAKGVYTDRSIKDSAIKYRLILSIPAIIIYTVLLVNSNIDYLNGFYYTFTLVAFAIGFDQILTILGDAKKQAFALFVKACLWFITVLVVMELDLNLYISANNNMYKRCIFLFVYI